MWIPSSWRFLLSSRTWLAPVTLATRADEAGEPPLKVLRDLGQPPVAARPAQSKQAPALQKRILGTTARREGAALPRAAGTRSELSGLSGAATPRAR